MNTCFRWSMGKAAVWLFSAALPLGPALAHGTGTEGQIRCLAFREPFSPDAESRRVFALGISAPPQIDGRLDDACWRDAMPATGFVEHHGPTARPLEPGQTEIRCTYTTDTLFVAARCNAVAPGKIRHELGGNDHDGDVFRDDCVELILVVSEAEMRFVVTAGGGRADSLDGDLKWNPEWATRTAVAETEWTAEIAIPFAILQGRRPPRSDDPGCALRFNVGRSTSPIRLVSSLFPGYDDPSRMGWLVVGTPDQMQTRAASRPRLHIESASLLLDKWKYDSADVSARGRLRLNGAGPSTVGPTAVRARLSVRAAGQEEAMRMLVTDPLDTAVIDFDIDVIALPPGEYQLRAELLDEKEQVIQTVEHSLSRVMDSPASVKGVVPLMVDLPDPTSAVIGPANPAPIYAGVPLPRNAATQTTTYRLFDSRGRELPCQTQPITSWSPGGNTQWLGLRFLADSTDVSGCELHFGESDSAASVPAKSIDVRESDDAIVVDTGPLRFEVLKSGFNGLNRAWFDVNGDGTLVDEEQVLADSTTGPAVTDASGTLYSMRLDPHPDVAIESLGPLSVVIRCSGWYIAEDGGRICRHTTRLTAYAGLPWTRVFHTFVFCADSRETAIADINWPVSLRSPEKAVRFGGETRPLVLPLADQETASLLQHESDAFALRRFRDGQAVTVATGTCAGGWAEASATGVAVAVGLRDFAATYPKELEARPGEVTLHLWPRNAVDKPVKQPTDDDLSELWFLHHRRLLDFQVPQWFSGFQSAGPFVNAEHEVSRHRYVRASASANGMGVARSCEFFINFRHPDHDTVRTVWAYVNHPPLATAAPASMCESGAFGPLSPVDRRNFPLIERALDLRHDGERTIERYSIGMFNYGGSTSYFKPWQHSYDQLDRPWRLMHHGSPRVPWLLFARSADRKFADYALRHGSWCADIGFCHYSTPAFERYGLDGKIRGGQCDYKGIVPWSRGGRLMDYNSMADFLLWMTCFSGNSWPLEVADEWGRCIKQRFRPVVGRNAAGTLDTLLSLYEMTWDMEYRELAERQFLAIADKEFMPSGHFRHGPWYDYAPWLAHYHRFTGSKKATAIAVAWANRLIRDCWLGDGTGGDDTKFTTEMGYPLYDVFRIAFEATQDRRHLALAYGCSMLPAMSTIHAPGTAFHGFDTYCTASHGGYYTQTVPYILPTLRGQASGRAMFPSWTLHARRIQFFVRTTTDEPLELRLRLANTSQANGPPVALPHVKFMDEHGRVAGPMPVEIVRLPVRDQSQEPPKDGENSHGIYEYARIQVPNVMLKGTVAIVIASPIARQEVGIRLPVMLTYETSLVVSWDRHMRFGSGSAVYFRPPKHARGVSFAAGPDYRALPCVLALLDSKDRIRAIRTWQPIQGADTTKIEAAVRPEDDQDVWCCLQGLARYATIDPESAGMPRYFSDRPERFFVPDLRR